MPAERGDETLVGSQQHHRFSDVAPGEGIEVEPQAAHAALVQALQLGERRLRRDHRRAAAARSELGERSEHCTVVGTVAARLHEHRALETHLLLHALVRWERRFADVVGALRRKRVKLERPEHMHVAIGRVRRQRLRGRAMRAVERFHCLIRAAKISAE